MHNQNRAMQTSATHQWRKAQSSTPPTNPSAPQWSARSHCWHFILKEILNPSMPFTQHLYGPCIHYCGPGPHSLTCWHGWQGHWSSSPIISAISHSSSKGYTPLGRCGLTCYLLPIPCSTSPLKTPSILIPFSTMPHPFPLCILLVPHHLWHLWQVLGTMQFETKSGLKIPFPLIYPILCETLGGVYTYIVNTLV